MQKNTWLLVLLLIIGLGVGYGVGTSRNAPQVVSTGYHMMADGTMMGNRTNTLSMTDMMSSMNAGLAGKTGDEFDKVFLSEMILHHQGAVQMAQSALQNAKHQEIKDLATGIISAQNKEIGDMQSWQKTWYN